MRNLILIAFYILPLFFFAKGNTRCSWTASKAGITLHYTSSCDKENQSALDDILNKALTLLKGRDTSLKILILINQWQLSFNNDRSLNFNSIQRCTPVYCSTDYYKKGKTLIEFTCKAFLT